MTSIYYLEVLLTQNNDWGVGRYSNIATYYVANLLYLLYLLFLNLLSTGVVSASNHLRAHDISDISLGKKDFLFS